VERFPKIHWFWGCNTNKCIGSVYIEHPMENFKNKMYCDTCDNSKILKPISTQD
jgi:hypothetical protein